MKKKDFQICIGGYCSGRNFENTLKLVHYLEEIEPNKLYAIAKTETGIVIVSKDEVVTKKKLENKIEELKKKKIPNGRLDLDIKNEAQINILQELLEK